MQGFESGGVAAEVQLPTGTGDREQRRTDKFIGGSANPPFHLELLPPKETLFTLWRKHSSFNHILEVFSFYIYSETGFFELALALSCFLGQTDLWKALRIVQCPI